MPQKRFANVLIVQKKKVHLAKNMEDFELCEDYFYRNTSSYSNEKENVHWLTSPFSPSKTGESFSAKTVSDWKIELCSKLFLPWIKGVDFDRKFSTVKCNLSLDFCFLVVLPTHPPNTHPPAPPSETFQGTCLLRLEKNGRTKEERKWNYFSLCKS